VCLHPFRLPHPLPPPAPALAARLRQDTAQRVFEQRRGRMAIWNTLMDVRFPALMAALCGYCGDMFAQFTAMGDLEASLLYNGTMVFCWVLCVVRPCSPTWQYRAAHRCSALREIAALVAMYFVFFFLWTMQCVMLPHVRGFARSGILHPVNTLALAGAVLLRAIVALCQPTPVPPAAPPPPFVPPPAPPPPAPPEV
jgi:hypothetical protein